MKKIFLITVMSLTTLALAAQTYNNPRQQSNVETLKVTKVERTANATVLYLRFSQPEGYTGWSKIDAYPTLTDEATGKKYQATDALNFNWGTKYTGTVTYKIEFPPMPRNTSVVTFRETAAAKNPFIVRNIAIPVKERQEEAQRRPETRQAPADPNVYDNPRHRSNKENVKITKVIRNEDKTIVHVTVKYNYFAIKILKTPTLIDQNNRKKYNSRNYINVNPFEFARGKSHTFKVEFPPLPKSCSKVTFRNDYEDWILSDIEIPYREPSSTTIIKDGKTIIIL